jgi:signal transduction histidine kinase/GAF domain-containing protein
MRDAETQQEQEREQERVDLMSNPSLPPLREPNWPKQTLDEIARAAASLLDASRVWVALHDRHGVIIPRIAIAVENGAPIAIDPRTAPELLSSIIKQLIERGPAAAPAPLTDLHAHPQLLRLAGPDAAVIRSLASAPLVDAGKIIGALIVGSAEPGLLTEPRRLVLNSLANVAVSAIRLTASVENEAAQARELGALLSASQALTNSLRPDEVFHSINESIQSVITFSSALIFRYDDHDKRLQVISSSGPGTESLIGSVIALSDPGSKAAWVARNQRYYVGLVRPEDDIGAHTDVLRRGATVSLLCMPLMSKGRLRGVASLARSQSFSTNEVNALARLSPIAAAALENVELYQQEQAARLQQEALFASASDGFALIDDQLRFIQVNEAFARYLAADPTLLLDQPSCLVFGATLTSTAGYASCKLCRNSSTCLLHEALTQRASRAHVECLFPPPPTPEAPDVTAPSAGPQVVGRTIDFSVTPVQGPEQRMRLLLVGRDMTSERELERSRSEFIRMTSHDMSAPLHTIYGHLDFLTKAKQNNLTPEQIAHVETALAAAESMKVLVADLALLSAREAGQWHIDPKPKDLSIEVAAAVEAMKLVALQKSVDLRMRVIPPLPPALVDAERAQQVARNLIINAIKFTPRGGRVLVSVFADAEWVVLQVEDSGRGIPEESVERIWERNYRAPQPEGVERVSGSGLGLAIVRIIVQAHHGHHFVKSTVGKGTIFTILFPHADTNTRR